MEILGEVNDITIYKDHDKDTKIKIRVVKSGEDNTIIDKVELIVDEDGKLILV